VYLTILHSKLRTEIIAQSEFTALALCQRKMHISFMMSYPMISHAQVVRVGEGEKGGCAQRVQTTLPCLCLAVKALACFKHKWTYKTVLSPCIGSNSNVQGRCFYYSKLALPQHSDWMLINRWVWSESWMYLGWLSAVLCPVWGIETQQNLSRVFLMTDLRCCMVGRRLKNIFTVTTLIRWQLHVWHSLSHSQIC